MIKFTQSCIFLSIFAMVYFYQQVQYFYLHHFIHGHLKKQFHHILIIIKVAKTDSEIVKEQKEKFAVITLS